MAKKLIDDQIKIVVDVEATGVQATLQQITAESLRFANANKHMQEEMKAAEKQMKEAAKTMEKLEKVGQTASIAYQEAKGTFSEAKKEIAAYKEIIEQNTKAIADNEKKHMEIIKTMSLEDMTMSQLKQRAAELKNQMDHTSASLSPEAYKKLDNELEKTKGRMVEVARANKNLLQQFATMHNPVGSAAKAIIGAWDAISTAFKTNPIGATITLIVAAFYALRNVLFKNEEAMNSINRLLAPMKIVFDAIVDVLQKLVVGFLTFAEVAVSGIAKLLERLPFVGKYMQEINDKAKEGIQLEKDKIALQQSHRQSLVENANKEKRIAELRNEAGRRDVYSGERRVEMMKEAIRLEDEIIQTKIEEANAELRILQIEAKRKKSNSELNDKIAEQKALIIGLETEFFNKTKRDQRTLSDAILETQNKAAEAARKARDNQLKEIDQTLNYEINQLKKTRMKGILTEKQYNDQVEQLTLEALRKKMAIKGQEKHQLIQYESQILDAEIKRQEKADKELLKELTDTKNNQLSLIESAKNTQLEQLQEQESDQQIYALRAAEIEAEAAKAREDVIRAFGSTVEQAEFQNAQTRIDAIKAAGKEVLAAETETLQQQANLRRLFAKTTADFERQYNIKTWEERQKDELRILEKQHKAGLLSEENYQKGILAIRKKYEDERFRTLQKYGLVSLRDQYKKEMDELKEAYARGLISLKEYEQGKLNIKLNYAEQYANKVAEFAQMGTDTVEALSEAETATLNVEYTKRQADLTEQYNQGILSQEEYNEQKEQLEYEQKVKELDIQKKYADANFGIQVAQILATTAQGVVAAWASAMQLGPIAGPIAAAAMSAMLGITAKAEITKAKAERDRVKAMTLEAPGGDTAAAPKTGARVLKQGFADGGYNDMSDGGFTGKGKKYEVAGYLPVHGGEYIVDAESLKYPDVMDKVRSIERVRRRHASSNPLPDGFAEGGSNAPASSPTTGYSLSEIMILSEVRDLLRYLKDNGVKAPIVLTELQKKEELQRRSTETFKKTK